MHQLRKNSSPGVCRAVGKQRRALLIGVHCTVIRYTSAYMHTVPLSSKHAVELGNPSNLLGTTYPLTYIGICFCETKEILIDTCGVRFEPGVHKLLSLCHRFVKN